jgi:hypothetical protein
MRGRNYYITRFMQALFLIGIVCIVSFIPIPKTIPMFAVLLILIIFMGWFCITLFFHILANKRYFKDKERGKK